MFKKNTLAGKLGLIFGIPIVLFAVMGVWFALEITGIVGEAGKAIEGNELRAKMAQLEAETRNWAGLLGDLRNNPDPAKLDAAADPNACAFGEWYHGDGRRRVEELIPELRGLLDRLEEPHTLIHESAAEIAVLFKEADLRPGETYHDSVVIRQVEEIFSNRTLPHLTAMRDTLTEVRTILAEGLVTKGGLEEAGSKAKRSILIFTVLAVASGLAAAFFVGRRLVNFLRGGVEGVLRNLMEFDKFSNQVFDSNRRMAGGANEQASSLEEVSSSMEEMASMTKENTSNANKANAIILEACSVAEKGLTAMNIMGESIDQIKASSNDMAKIIKTIDEIAFQTNLLALNAAVEAARAGEAGKGFAVVAEEVRNLAQRSAEAARNTSMLIETSQHNSENVIHGSDEVGGIFGEISEGILNVSEILGSVASASEEQFRGIEQINTALTNIDQVTQSNAAHAEETASSSGELLRHAKAIEDMVAELSEWVGSAENDGPADVGPAMVGERALSPAVPTAQPILDMGAFKFDAPAANTSSRNEGVRQDF